MHISVKELKRLIKVKLDEAHWRVSPPKSKQGSVQAIDVEADSKRDAAQSAVNQWNSLGHSIDPFTVDIEELPPPEVHSEPSDNDNDMSAAFSDALYNVLDQITSDISHALNHIEDYYSDSQLPDMGVSEQEFRNAVIEELSDRIKDLF